jgi:light-regulated signal transduction histidine kinase (bacteriophytochrome)
MLSSLAGELEDSMASESWQQMNTSIDRARGTIELCQSMLANGQSEELDVQLPVEVATIVRAAVTETRVAAEQQGKTITTDVPNDLPDVLANPQRLRQVISTTIGVMVDNSQANSLIHLGARSQLGRVIITIKNEGCGLALDRLTQSRLATPDESSSEISRLLKLREWMQGWGGELLVDSELGEGASIRLSLRHFNWSDLHEQLATAGTSPDRHLERRE